MRPQTFILLIVLATLGLSLAPVSHHKVKFVYDGDTILLNSGEHVRYLGINAPEIDHEAGKSEFMAYSARNLNRKLVAGDRVRLEHDREKSDQYGRLLAYVFSENGNMINALLVRKGLAHVMFKNRNLKYRDLLLDCQRKAMEERLGIWNRPFKGEEEFYLGNGNSGLFHRPMCHFGKKISTKNLVRFKTRHDAFWDGYSPCKRCGP
jgi:micrococcal nuclease